MHPSEDHGPAMEMPRYKSHKQVWALKIESVGEAGPVGTGDRPGRGGYRLTFSDRGYAPIMAPAEMFSRYMPTAGDYYVVYDDGYKSISPAKAFEEGYTRLA